MTNFSVTIENGAYCGQVLVVSWPMGEKEPVKVWA
jgi:hypothetical protein